MNRARLLGVLAILILLVCVVVIALDQQGVFGQIPAPGPFPSPNTQQGPAGGYGDIK